MEEGLQCGGAYIKLIREKDDGTKFVMEDLDNETPYSIMFGPDHCGALNNKIHFIMQHKSEYSNSYEQKHFKEMSPMLLDKKTHLYTALIRGEATSGIMSEPNSIEYFVDMKSIKHGSLFTHMVIHLLCF